MISHLTQKHQNTILRLTLSRVNVSLQNLFPFSYSTTILFIAIATLTIIISSCLECNKKKKNLQYKIYTVTYMHTELSSTLTPWNCGTKITINSVSILFYIIYKARKINWISIQLKNKTIPTTHFTYTEQPEPFKTSPLVVIKGNTKTQSSCHHTIFCCFFQNFLGGKKIKQKKNSYRPCKGNTCHKHPPQHVNTADFHN